MKHQIKNFLEILKLELDDLNEDIQTLKQECEYKLKKGVITNYVHMENMALYDNELHAVNAFRRIVEVSEPDSFHSLDDLVIHINETFRTVMKACGYAEAGRISIERKMLKVAKYIRSN